MPVLPSESFLPHPTPPTASCLGLFQEMAWGTEGKGSLQEASRERTLVGSCSKKPLRTDLVT